MLFLLIVASIKEAKKLIDYFQLLRDTDFTIPDPPHESVGLYKSDICHLLITGVLEHHAVSSLATLLLSRSNKHYDFLINFGCCGRYNREDNKAILGNTYLVKTSCRFDVDDNLHWT